MYDELMKMLRTCAERDSCIGCPYLGTGVCDNKAEKAADAIEELRRAAKAMHTWIFLNTGDEQAVYDECGLSDEMNAEFGYGGQFILEPPKEEGENDEYTD